MRIQGGKTMVYKKVCLSETAKGIKGFWTQLKIGSVGNYDVKMAIYSGEYRRHMHKNHDEFIFVLKGNVRIDIDGEEIALNAGDGIFIEKGTAHKSICDGKAEVLLFEKDTIMEDYIDV